MLSYLLVEHIRQTNPDVKIYIWSGYLYEDLLELAKTNYKLRFILDNSNYLIDGPFILAKRDITLWMRGSPNQRIWDLKNKKEIKEKSEL